MAAFLPISFNFDYVEEVPFAPPAHGVTRAHPGNPQPVLPNPPKLKARKLPEQEFARRSGRVKTFFVEKGFGQVGLGPTSLSLTSLASFIVDDHPDELNGHDVFVHYAMITNCEASKDGFRSLRAGEPVEYSVHVGDKGYWASHVTGPGDTSVLGHPDAAFGVHSLKTSKSSNSDLAELSFNSTNSGISALSLSTSSHTSSNASSIHAHDPVPSDVTSLCSSQTSNASSACYPGSHKSAWASPLVAPDYQPMQGHRVQRPLCPIDGNQRHAVMASPSPVQAQHPPVLCSPTLALGERSIWTS